MTLYLHLEIFYYWLMIRDHILTCEIIHDYITTYSSSTIWIRRMITIKAMLTLRRELPWIQSHQAITLSSSHLIIYNFILRTTSSNIDVKKNCCHKRQIHLTVISNSLNSEFLLSISSNCFPFLHTAKAKPE